VFADSRFIPKSIKYKIWDHREKDPHWRERRRVSVNGGDPDKIYYVIRRKHTRAGLMSMLLVTMGHIRYACSKGYIPVVDWKNNLNPYLIKEEVGKINAWETFFEQPCGVSLEDCEKKSKLIISNGNDIRIVCGRPAALPEFFGDDDSIDFYRQLYKKYIKLNKATSDYLDNDYCRMLQGIEGEERKNPRILGVLARGTDYIKIRPKGHPIQPDIDTLIEKCEEMMAEYDCEYLFVATEDKDFDNKFKEKFGNRYICNERCYIDYKEGLLADVPSENGNEIRTRGLQYLSNLNILSKCNVLIGGQTNGLVGAVLMAEGFEHLYVFDLGYY